MSASLFVSSMYAGDLKELLCHLFPEASALATLQEQKRSWLDSGSDSKGFLAEMR